jgi:four helix bundle protein
LVDASVSYRDLKVWQKAMDLAENCYRATQTFPAEERYGLTAQIRRSAVSVASNIAEGYGRDNDGSFVQFLRVSQGSLKELETQIILSGRIGVMTSSVAGNLLSNADEIGRMLRGLINSVNDRRTQ